MWAVESILSLQVETPSQKREHREPESLGPRGIRHKRAAALMHSQQLKLPARSSLSLFEHGGCGRELTVDGPHIQETTCSTAWIHSVRVRRGSACRRSWGRGGRCLCSQHTVCTPQRSNCEAGCTTDGSGVSAPVAHQVNTQHLL